MSSADSLAYCVVVAAGIFLVWQLRSHAVLLLFICYSFWIPPIVHNIQRDVKQSLQPAYVFGMSISRLLLPLYAFGCPYNILRTSPDEDLCWALVGWVGLQVAVLMAQHIWGAR